MRGSPVGALVLMPLFRFPFAVLLVLALAAHASAQDADPNAWSGSVAAGLTLTGGNASTTTTNFTFALQSPEAARNTMRAEGLNIFSRRDGDAIVDRTSLSVRDEYELNARTFVFAQFQYLRDVFKVIDYLIAPTLGVGVKLADSQVTNVSVDASVGAVVERNANRPEQTSGAMTLRETVNHKVSETATFTQSFNALWKTADFGDALYTFQVGLAASVTTRIQVKVEFIDTFKTEPPDTAVRRNDTALVTSFGFTF